jgi:hypothetical protein
VFKYAVGVVLIAPATTFVVSAAFVNMAAKADVVPDKVAEVIVGVVIVGVVIVGLVLNTFDPVPVDVAVPVPPLAVGSIKYGDTVEITNGPL